MAGLDPDAGGGVAGRFSCAHSAMLNPFGTAHAEDGAWRSAGGSVNLD